MHTPFCLLSAARKIMAGASINLNFEEVRQIGLRYSQSYEREIEMAVDEATDHNVGMTLQFFEDAHGAHIGYSGALQCMESYADDPRWPAFTKAAYTKLISEVETILTRLSKRAHDEVRHVNRDGVEYEKWFGIWRHAGSGQQVKPVRADGTTMTDREFELFINTLNLQSVVFEQVPS